jgi:hypothetical protein
VVAPAPTEESSTTTGEAPENVSTAPPEGESKAAGGAEGAEAADESTAAEAAETVVAPECAAEEGAPSE